MGGREYSQVYTSIITANSDAFRVRLTHFIEFSRSHTNAGNLTHFRTTTIKTIKMCVEIYRIF